MRETLLWTAGGYLLGLSLYLLGLAVGLRLPTITPVITGSLGFVLARHRAALRWRDREGDGGGKAATERVVVLMLRLAAIAGASVGFLTGSLPLLLLAFAGLVVAGTLSWVTMRQGRR